MRRIKSLTCRVHTDTGAYIIYTFLCIYYYQLEFQWNSITPVLPTIYPS